jgi:two-component system NarL family sensor kinase
LSAIALNLETADALLESRADPERVGRAVRQALALTRANLDEARCSVLDLRAAPLEGRNLAQTLAELVEKTIMQDLAVSFEAVGEHHPLPVCIEVGLYRIAQEALINVARHANARHATLRLVMTPEHVRLAVDDDGQGFDPPQVPQGRYGLVGMNERTNLLEGTLGLESCSGAGTRL